MGEHEEREEQLAALRQRFPGWQIWASGIAWCAQPQPLINAASAEELAGAIAMAHGQPPYGSPSLASARSYAARVRALREYEEATAIAWRRRKARPRRRPKALPPSQAEPQAEPPGVA